MGPHRPHHLDADHDDRHGAGDAMPGLQLDCGPGVYGTGGSGAGGFDWTDLFDDIQQHTLSPRAGLSYPRPKTPGGCTSWSPSSPPSSPPFTAGGFFGVTGFGESENGAGEGPRGEGFSWLDLWDDSDRGADVCQPPVPILPPTPESLQRPFQGVQQPVPSDPSTPVFPEYSFQAYDDSYDAYTHHDTYIPHDTYTHHDHSFPSSLPSLVTSQSSPSSYHLQTPRFDPPTCCPSPATAGHRPLLPSHAGAPSTPGGWGEDNPFLAKHAVTPSPATRKKKRPQWRTGLEVPADWAGDDTPTPMRFLVEGYGEAPRQPVFAPVPAPVTFKAENPVVSHDAAPPITWITHLSTDGGLPLSLRRLKSLPSLSSDSGRAGPHVISGASMFISHPKRRVPELAERSTTIASEFRGAMRGMAEGFARRSMAHGVHTVNLLSVDPELRRRSKASVISEMEWARELGIPTLVIHLGSGGNDNSSTGRKRQVRRLIGDLREIVAAVPEVTLALENTLTPRAPPSAPPPASLPPSSPRLPPASPPLKVHPSPTSPTTLTSLVSLLPFFPPGRLKLCLDLCHLHVCEFDLNSPAGRAGLFGQLEKAGRGSVVGVHVSDSYVGHGARGDRHANLGFGHIQLYAFREVLSHPFFSHIPHLLETPRYFKHFRPTSSPHSLLLSHLEAERAGLERALLQWIVGAPAKEWVDSGGGSRGRGGEAQGDGRGKVWAEYKKRKKQLENRIYKIISKRAGAVLARFKKGRKKDVGCCRVVEGVKWREKRCVKMGGVSAENEGKYGKGVGGKTMDV